MKPVNKHLGCLCCDEILEFWVEMEFEVINVAALISALTDRGIRVSFEIGQTHPDRKQLTFRLPTGVTQGRQDILEALADIEQSAAKLRKAQSVLSIFGG